MPTTVIIKDDAYRAIIRKQTELLEKNGKKVSIGDIVEQSVLKGIDLVT